MSFLSDLPWSLPATILYVFLIQCSANLILLVSVTQVIRIVKSTNFKVSSMVKCHQTLIFCATRISWSNVCDGVFLLYYSLSLYGLTSWKNKGCVKNKTTYFNAVNHTVLLTIYITIHSLGWWNRRWKLCLCHPIFISTFLNSNTLYLSILNYGSLWLLFYIFGLVMILL
jgi:hypothetical protein